RGGGEGEAPAVFRVAVAPGGGGLAGEERRQARHPPAAAGARPRARLDTPDGAQRVLRDGAPDLALRHVVAGADLRLVAERGRRLGRVARPEEELVRPRRERALLAHEGEERWIRSGVADEDAADEPLAVRAQSGLLVAVPEPVLIPPAPGTGPFGEGVAEGRHVDAEELQLRREIRSREPPVLAAETRGEHVGHLVAGADQ